MAKAGRASPGTSVVSGGSVKLVWINASVICLIVVSAFGVIQTSHACRQLYAQLQILEASRWYMEEDFGRLLLEQSTWASYHRIERVAGRELNMKPPGIANMRLVRQ